MKALIFDLDGVLTDTSKLHYQAWKRLAESFGVTFTPQQNEAFKGVSRSDCMKLMAVHLGQPDMSQARLDELAEQKNSWYLALLAGISAANLLPEVDVVLAQLHRDNIRMMVGSSSKNTGLLLSRLGITNFFCAVCDGSMVARAKPDPDIFLTAAELGGAAAADCIVFEDAAAGVLAAHRAGMLCVGVGDRDTLSEADYVIPDLAHLMSEDALMRLIYEA